ncbi:MAG: phosphatase PAP2 family protein [Ruminococcaceae bacterium]|nr:phosphatase PAP2 family protein [Oscillospiraceae bacterium]
MEILRFLEDLRTPVLDEFFALVTRLGEETLFILAGLVFFWCVSKKQGYYLLSVGFLGTVLNQFLKLLFRIPRPWLRDKSFTIVESARAEATGYSFPSGHTQSAVGVFGSIARLNHRWWVRLLCIIACVLVPLSRMWLGVHTPADVGVSIVVALVLVFLLYPLVNKAFDRPGTARLFFGSMLLLSAAYLAFVYLYPFPADTDPENLTHGIKNAYKILGCVLGLWVAYEVDARYIRFDTRAVWWAQLLKLVLGLVPLLLIKSGLKEPLYALFAGSYLADGVRYALITLFAGCVWPLTFRFFSRCGKK